MKPREATAQSRTRNVAEGTLMFLRAATVATLATAGTLCMSAAAAIAGTRRRTAPVGGAPSHDLGVPVDQVPADQEVFLDPEYVISEIEKVPPCPDCLVGNRLRLAVEAGQLQMRVITPHDLTCPAVLAHERATAGES